jgi:hypothetical protein
MRGIYFLKKNVWQYFFLRHKKIKTVIYKINDDLHESLIFYKSFNTLCSIKSIATSQFILSEESHVVPGSERITYLTRGVDRLACRLAGWLWGISGLRPRYAPVRTPLLRLYNMQNGGTARFLPHPPQLRCFSFLTPNLQIYKIIYFYNTFAVSHAI